VRLAALALLLAAACATVPAGNSRTGPAVLDGPAWAAPDFGATPAPGLAPATAPDLVPRAELDEAPAAAPGPALEPAAAPRPEPGAEDPVRARAVGAAQGLVGKPSRTDCSGFVLSAWRAAGVRPRLAPARSRSESLYRATRRVESPRPGDLAFFHHTYDRNRDGRVNDLFSHVALVEVVDGDAVTLLHRGARGVERVRMDLARPSDPALNDPVRVLRRGERRKVRTLAGELFAGFGALPPGGDVAAR
jgi:hypothetical protein